MIKTKLSFLAIPIVFFFLVFEGPLYGQDNTTFPKTSLDLSDLSGFRSAGANWSIVNALRADVNQENVFLTEAGNGVLVNQPTTEQRNNLVTKLEHGDLDLEVEFMMAKGANSGIYLQGRYEVQLLDSWNKINPGFGDCGGIYERWRDDKPEGQKGYEGYAPRVNVCRAPGLWQKIEISFQAPRFDSSGKKISNARILEVKLNGVVLHEDLELTGPTRGPMIAEEGALGPILLQGDHGAVAFRNFRYRSYTEGAPQLQGLTYQFSRGIYDYPPDFATAQIDDRGPTPGLSWEAAKTVNEFGLEFKGTITLKDAGPYRFIFTSNGNGELTIGGKKIITNAWWTRSNTVDLPAGELPVIITYAKREGWLQPRLGIFMEGASFRSTALHMPSSYVLSNPVPPIVVTPDRETQVMRCFVDIPKGEKDKERIVHAISVGEPSQMSYTYDADKANLVQIWRGAFLDATPMWNDRGDGSSKPLGSVILLDNAPDFQVLEDKSTAWTDSLGATANFRFRGYDLNETGSPIFKYDTYNLKVTDEISAKDKGEKLSRRIEVKGTPVSNLYLRIASASKIKEVEPNLYIIGDQMYYLYLEGTTPTEIRTVQNQQELLIPITQAGVIAYALIW